MIYNATPQRAILLFFFVIAIWGMLTSRDHPEMYYFLIPFSIFILATVLMQFEFKIGAGSMTFKILILTLTIYKKEVHFNQIVGMKFKRVGWGKKCVIVQNNKGLNFRITDFHPKKIYNDLIGFANEHDISIFKTKDYLILEKLK